MEAHTSQLEVRQAPSRLPDLGGRNEKRVAGALIAPGQLLMAFIVLFPAAIAIYIGFTSWGPTTGRQLLARLRVLALVRRLLGSADVQRPSGAAMWRTVLITVVCVAVEFVLGFGLALLLLKSFRGRGFVTVFFLLPMMVVPAVSGFIFLMLFQLDGPVNEALEAIFGLDEPIAVAPEPGSRHLVGDGRRHLAVDAAHVPDLPLRAGGAAGGSDERGADPRRALPARAALPHRSR